MAEKKKMFVEIFDTSYGDEAQCGLCGSSVEFEDCESCNEGVSGHDCGEDTCCCLYPEDNMACDDCDGIGGWWHCLTCGFTHEVRRLKQKEVKAGCNADSHDDGIPPKDKSLGILPTNL